MFLGQDILCLIIILIYFYVIVNTFFLFSASVYGFLYILSDFRTKNAVFVNNTLIFPFVHFYQTFQNYYRFYTNMRNKVTVLLQIYQKYNAADYEHDAYMNRFVNMNKRGE